MKDRDLNHPFSRMLFSLAFTCSTVPWAAEATDPETFSTQDHPHVITTTTRAGDPRDIVLNLEPARDQPVSTPYKALGRVYSDDSARQVLSHTVVVTDELSILRAGVGMDLNLSEIGNLHFNLYSPDGDLNKGKRWTFGTSNDPTPIVCKKIWSFGGTLELTRTHPSGPRTVVFVPQLMFNLESLRGVGNKVQMTLQYQHWNGGSGNDDDRAMPQVSIKWSF